MERKIGEIIEFDDVELKVVEVTKEEEKASEACVGCYFFHEDVSECSDFKEDTYTEKQLGSCYKNKRTDKKSVKFIKVRKCDSLEKLTGKVTGVGEIPTGDITKFNKIEPLKISTWEDLTEVKKGDLEVEIIRPTKNKTVLDVFEFSIIDITYDVAFSTVFYEKNLDIAVEILKEFGFDVEYEEKFNLVDFLKASLEPKEFNFNELNFYFAFDEHKYITMFNEDDYKTLNCRYFDKIIDDISCVEETLKNKKVTIKQLKFALKELGWI